MAGFVCCLYFLGVLPVLSGLGGSGLGEGWGRLFWVLTGGFLTEGARSLLFWFWGFGVWCIFRPPTQPTLCELVAPIIEDEVGPHRRGGVVGRPVFSSAGS